MGLLNVHIHRHRQGALGLVIPARNEAEALPMVLRELTCTLESTLPALQYVVAVGANACADRTVEVARENGALTGYTATAGYGHGCMAAIQAILRAQPDTAAYLFLSADGANDPAEIPKLLHLWEDGYDLVLGSRTDRLGNFVWPLAQRRVSNLVLAAWTSLLSGHDYRDLGPFRIIDRELFERMEPSELTWGWTIEPQIKAARLDAEIIETPVAERPRVAGEQKVSGVSWRHSLNIGAHIAGAGWRVATQWTPKKTGPPVN